MGLLLEQEVRKEQLEKWRYVQKKSLITLSAHIFGKSPLTFRESTGSCLCCWALGGK